MKTYTREELAAILEKHAKWLRDEDGGERADLSYANLRYADLRYADLRYANLRYADLRYADLPALTVVLLADWGELPDEICLHLMRLDASAHDDPKSFEVWANNGPCPYAERKYQRCANFKEKRSIYIPGPAPTIYEAAMMVLREKTKGWEPK